MVAKAFKGILDQLIEYHRVGFNARLGGVPHIGASFPPGSVYVVCDDGTKHDILIVVEMDPVNLPGFYQASVPKTIKGLNVMWCKATNSNAIAVDIRHYNT